jgi:hypothetical protein
MCNACALNLVDREKLDLMGNTDIDRLILIEAYSVLLNKGVNGWAYRVEDPLGNTLSYQLRFNSEDDARITGLLFLKNHFDSMRKLVEQEINDPLVG